MNAYSRTLALIASLSAFFIAPPVVAQTFGPPATSAKQPAASVVTTQQAKTLADDVEVVLEGRITRLIRNEHYRFKDSSGWIEVEIDDDDWNGVTTTPQQQVRLIGEIDRNRRSVKVDVDRVERL